MPNPDFATFTSITRSMYEYAYGVDCRDWVLYRSIFTDDIEVDFSSYHGQDAVALRADDWVSHVQVMFAGFASTQHSMSNPLVDQLDAENARCRMYMQAEHFLEADLSGAQTRDKEYALGGYYDNRLLRTDTGWKIRAVKLNVTWQRGSRQIMDVAARLGAERLGSA